VREPSLAEPGIPRAQARTPAGSTVGPAWATSVRGVTTAPGPDEQDARDRVLLAAHLAGDPQAFDELVRRNRQRMWAVALRTLGDPEEAADAVQDACISAFRAAGSFRGDARVTTWLHRIVVNACLDRARRRAVRPTVPLPEQPPADPRDQMAERETSLEVERALAGLPEEQRLAIVLVDLQGMSVEEAAAVLGIPGGTVKSRCFRGRARLAVVLSFLRDAPHPGNPGNLASSEPVPPVPAPEVPSEGGSA
jgi:RNA polymerase sigma-70 factor (ECF subfamily)